MSSGRTLKVGTEVTPSNLAKNLLISAAEALPTNLSTARIIITAGEIKTNTTASTQTMYAPCVLPPNVTIKKVQIHGNRGTTAGALAFTFYRLTTGGSATNIATKSSTLTGWQTLSSSAMNELASSGRRYLTEVKMKGGPGVQGPVHFQFVNISYVMPSYDRGY